MRSWSLLLITDLHYEDADSNFSDDNKDSIPQGYRDNLFLDYDNILRNGFNPGSLDLIAIAGDITTHGKVQGFTPFLQSMGSMQTLVKNRPSICVVPGNHDVEWGLNPGTKDSFTKKFRPFLNMVEKAGIISCLYPEGELGSETDSNLALREPPQAYGPIYVDHKSKLLVMCINSAIRCGEIDGRMETEIASPIREAMGKLQQANPSGTAKEAAVLLEQAGQKLQKCLIRDVAHVTKEQRNALSKRLIKWQVDLGAEWHSYLRVAVLHHHLIRFPGQVTEHRGYELLVDSGDMLAMLAGFDFDLVLTGHKHQPYIEPYLTQKKQLLIVGGPTVGGQPAGGSFRGLRWIEVEDRSESRVFSTTDIPLEIGQGNVLNDISERRKNATTHELPRNAEASWAQFVRKRGFSYREMASITVLDEDGDARRTVECEDFLVSQPGIERSRLHTLSLPLTSGYLAQLGASGKDFSIKIENPIDRKERKRSWEATLRFSEEIGIGKKPASYSYRWYAVNAFAMDKRQYGYMYRDRRDLWEIEFTHFIVEDPVADFTLVVRFPEKFKMESQPRVRVAFVDAQQSDTRKWEIDVRERNELEQAHALHYYESLNIAALRVKRPRTDVSYGIQWQVPLERRDPDPDGIQEATIAALRERWQHGITNEERTALLKQLARICEAAVSTVLHGWRKPIDANLMYFDGTELPTLVALKVTWPGPEPHGDEIPDITPFRYGDGIGGRAFKTNRLRVYVQTPPESGLSSTEPDYYTYLGTGPRHKVLVSMPVHIAETNLNFKKNNRIYELKVPYGVFSIGSEEPNCPLASLRLPERVQDALRFQHDVNVQLYECVKQLFSV